MLDVCAEAVRGRDTCLRIGSLSYCFALPVFFFRDWGAILGESTMIPITKQPAFSLYEVSWELIEKKDIYDSEDVYNQVSAIVRGLHGAEKGEKVRIEVSPNSTFIHAKLYHEDGSDDPAN